ncbi:hypothetical protein [Candidatus Albibeggiatoa sp. nov. NOAA]|uniref:hypothetical protein n=1 Tax=Candidatus Albibeggiatoa sp. nov. NOAA TaxID=3162724 RepID=UPI003301AEB6|nr:hypothetical protein [Thiotrichaceae bacterium]
MPKIVILLILSTFCSSCIKKTRYVYLVDGSEISGQTEQAQPQNKPLKTGKKQNNNSDKPQP